MPHPSAPQPQPSATASAAPALDLSVTGTPEGVRAALRATRAHPAIAALPVEMAERLELVLAEVLNNIVEHACRDRPGAAIALRLWPEGDGLACSATDDGVPMPGHALPAGISAAPDPAAPPDTLPEGGFGWFMIHALARSLRYDRVGAQNHLRFVIPRLDTPEGGGDRDSLS